ncbi:nicotinate-nicotinamide nucleotide adenylyltransferase [Vibrio pectenicida]|uniref:nicotinate-nucleotide adenylyltransferase n=1 Tax=Vibrio pectenicida TaxID=62763 RepID=A0A3R9FR09_9VIBR|nr:nicotinate-nicotinamide nucleotide adenylyltransferase [Vibrio pectenicida]NOH70868.1 nicotinate-nicotinamide nucleotide adenylyltransferase [Vibrio pectenicida]RSD32347.1 nicotinate-nicotinamide nucleotide adenylyltransferase [Vibrio pectenicida]
MNKIAVFGSAFNPPSLGHKSIVESLRHFDRVLLVPSISHAWGKEMLEYAKRCHLVEAFIEDLLLENVELSLIEERVYQPKHTVTTYAVLSELQNQYPNDNITFVIGPDNLFNFAKFYKADEILSTWSVMACPEKVRVRSTDIRQAIAKKQDISSLTTPRVCQLLNSKKFY